MSPITQKAHSATKTGSNKEKQAACKIPPKNVKACNATKTGSNKEKKAAARRHPKTEERTNFANCKNPTSIGRWFQCPELKGEIRLQFRELCLPEDDQDMWNYYYECYARVPVDDGIDADDR